MNLKHEQIEYEFSDEHSENDGIMLGYLQTGLDNTIKKILHNQISKVQIVGIEDADNISYYYIEDMQNENKGHILNVASIAGFLPGPLMAAYYSSKAYNHWYFALRYWQAFGKADAWFNWKR